MEVCGAVAMPIAAHAHQFNIVGVGRRAIVAVEGSAFVGAILILLELLTCPQGVPQHHG
jgi:hypothetical protein